MKENNRVKMIIDNTMLFLVKALRRCFEARNHLRERRTIDAKVITLINNLNTHILTRRMFLLTC